MFPQEIIGFDIKAVEIWLIFHAFKILSSRDIKLFTIKFNLKSMSIPGTTLCQL
jgi:hypothetical protein